MSQEIRDLALRATQGGAQGFFDLLEEYVVCDNRGHPRLDVADVSFGRDAVIRGYTTWWGTFEEYSVEAEDITDLGRTAVVRIKESGRGKGSGIPIEFEHTQVWTFRKAQIIHIELFGDHEEALEAAGMPQEATSLDNAEIVRRVFDAANRRDSASVLSLYDEDIVWDHSQGPIRELMGGPAVYRGHDGLRRWFREYYEAWEHVEAEIIELIEASDQVISISTYKARGRASGVEVELSRVASLWTIRDGKVVSAAWFRTRAEALDAAGLQE